jgi:transcriptional regulator with XRE-family HTH domain
MTNTREVILTLKEVRKEKNLSFDKILDLMKENGDYLSKSTLSRVFAEGSEDKSFRYEETLRPIANALLDIETIETDDDIDTQAYKSILKLKKDLLVEYESQIRNLKEEIDNVKRAERDKYHEKMEKETALFQKNLAFLNHQVELKDHRIDHLLDANEKLLNQLLLCNKCKERGNDNGSDKV